MLTRLMKKRIYALLSQPVPLKQKSLQQLILIENSTVIATRIRAVLNVAKLVLIEHFFMKETAGVS